jgi:hypothetical protein
MVAHDVPQETICKFFQLRPYLDAGLTVDDITTAIQTAWKMAGPGAQEKQPPQLTFHKETSLLIAVGMPERLELIQNILGQLYRPSEKSSDKKPRE